MSPTDLNPNIPTDDQSVRALAAETGIASALARLLVARGYRTRTEAMAYLTPRLADLHSPFDLPDMAQAVARVRTALRKNEPILVWGHEDLDGITAAVCLRETIKDLRGSAAHYIPAKGSERHGLNPDVVKGYADRGFRLVITVDCGITNCQEIERIQADGVDVIVTDHHEVLDNLPEAIAVVNPKREDSQYPFPLLAGVGVAMKFASALASDVVGVNTSEFFSAKPNLLTMVALGTIADRVSLTGENRILVHHGLEQMRRSRQAAVRAVLEAGRLDLTELTVTRFVTDLLPLFASADGNAGVEMFLGHDLSVTRGWVHALERQYQAWRDDARRSLSVAEQVLDIAPGIIFVQSEELSLRTLGHCAAKLKEQYLLPVIVMGRRDEDWVGECRGVEGVNLVELLRANSRYFRDCGGHPKACGFTVSDDNLEQFIGDAKAYAAAIFVGHIQEQKTRKPETVIALSEITSDFRKLAPFGEGNPYPLLLSRGTRMERLGSRVTSPDAPQLVIVEDSATVPDSGRYDVLYELDDHLRVILRSLQPSPA